MLNEIEFLRIENRIGNWTLPAKFCPKSTGGDNPEVSGVIGQTAIGNAHSVHIIETLLLAASLKKIEKENHPIVIVDAGAHIGTVTIGTSQVFSAHKEKSIFYSIEMSPEIFFCLKNNVEDNTDPAYTEVHLLNAPLTDLKTVNANKKLNIRSFSDWDIKSDPKTCGCLTYSTEKKSDVAYHALDPTTIDEVLKNETNDITALKIDCEGSDFSVLNGAIKTIKKSRPVILFESEDTSNAVFSLDYTKSNIEKAEFWIQIKNLVPEHFIDFFQDLNYKIIRNWFYDSWQEYIAIPCEHYEKLEISQMVRKDVHFAGCFADVIKRENTSEHFANTIWSIVGPWNPAVREKWLIKNNIQGKDGFVEYCESLFIRGLV